MVAFHIATSIIGGRNVAFWGVETCGLCYFCLLAIGADHSVQAHFAANLGGLPGSTYSGAFAVNDAGEVVGDSGVVFGGTIYAMEWSGGSVIDLGGLP